MKGVLAPHLQVPLAPHLSGTFYIFGYPADQHHGGEVVMAGAARFPTRRSKPAFTFYGGETADLRDQPGLTPLLSNAPERRAA